MQDLNLSERAVFGNVLSKNYTGIGRLAYFLMSVGWGIGGTILNATLGGAFDSEVPVVTLFTLIVGLLLAVLRLQNIGMSAWWAFLNFVPIANIWLAFRLITAQEGYVETNELDSTGRTVAVIFVGLIVSVLLLAVCAAIFS